MFKNRINLFSKLISYVVLNSHQCFSTLISFLVFLRILKMVIEFCAGDKYPFENHINVFSKLIYYVVLNYLQCFFHPYLLLNILRILKMVIEFLFKYFKNGGKSQIISMFFPPISTSQYFKNSKYCH